jgi:hypothetical protein
MNPDGCGRKRHLFFHLCFHKTAKRLVGSCPYVSVGPQVTKPNHRVCSNLERAVLKPKPIPVVTRSKAWVYGRSLTGIVGSNPDGGMEVCVL